MLALVTRIAPCVEFYKKINRNIDQWVFQNKQKQVICDTEKTIQKIKIIDHFPKTIRHLSIKLGS
jgi:hypothetical protein